MSRLLLAAAFALSSTSAHADVVAGPYDRGAKGIEVILGGVRAYGRTSFLAGFRVGYFVLPGLELGAGASLVFREDPMMGHVTIDPRYVLYPVDWTVRPYVGTFYHRWLIEGPYEDDQDGVGAELGVVSRQFRGAEVGFGVAVEYAFSDCYRDCVRVYGTTRVRMFFF